MRKIPACIYRRLIDFVVERVEIQLSGINSRIVYLAVKVHLSLSRFIGCNHQAIHRFHL